ncbi:hypothetical protein ACFFR3_37145 [Nonomuraea salmonea]|uniref:DUF1109 domain-containing protein n=2 Tax=Nonomuraea salmonea TaxID=46181 RepID=A0ABV5NXZ3_9ACTN
MPARSLVLLIAALLLGGLAAFVYVQDSSLVLLREHLNHPFAFSVLACTLVVLAALGLRWKWLRALVIILAGLAGSGALLIGLFLAALGSQEDIGFVDGPDPYRVRLQQSMAGLGPDSITWLSLRRDDGLLSREWHVACFNGDDPADAYESVRWTGTSSFEIRVNDERTFPVSLDPASGRPKTTVAVNC